MCTTTHLLNLILGEAIDVIFAGPFVPVLSARSRMEKPSRCEKSPPAEPRFPRDITLVDGGMKLIRRHDTVFPKSPIARTKLIITFRWSCRIMRSCSFHISASEVSYISSFNSSLNWFSAEFWILSSGSTYSLIQWHLEVLMPAIISHLVVLTSSRTVLPRHYVIKRCLKRILTYNPARKLEAILRSNQRGNSTGLISFATQIASGTC